MPTSETRIAARDASGVELYYQHSTLPTKENVAAYEAFYHGAAKKMLDMASADQDDLNRIRDRDSRLEFVTRICGLCFGFVLIVLLLGAGTYLIATDKPLGGYASLILGLLSAIAAIAAGGRKYGGSAS